LAEIDEILYGDDDVEDHIDSILLYLVASTIPSWWTFKFLGGATIERIFGLG
jgi:hypothetical protein